MEFNLNYSQFNERSILIEWPPVIDENILKSIFSFKKNIQSYVFEQKVEIINTYSSILIIYEFTIDNINDELLKLESIFSKPNLTCESQFSTWEIPVCYDEEFGIDLHEYSKEKKLSKSKIVKLHSDQIYKVYFIGFLPGFLYLGGLNSQLFLDRKTAPNLNVKKGSVAIGGEQTGIYPQDSPGGWHVIGKTPIQLFNASHKPPCCIDAGDNIRFKPISKREFYEIEKRIIDSSFQLKPISNA